MKVSIITINYNGSESTIKLLNSLAEQTDKDFQIIVIDNASEEADFKNLESTMSTMGTMANAMVPMVIRNQENLGFSGGNNIGIKEALKNKTDWVLLLNNDTWVERDFIASIKPILAQKQGILGLPMNEGKRISYCGKVEWLKPTLSHFYYVKHSVFNIYAIGGAVAVSKDVFDRIGLLDETYFLYFEDADFSIRARKAGIPISIAQGFMIYHKASSTTKKLGSPLLLRYHYRNALYFNLKNGPLYIKLLVWPWSFLILLKQMIKITLDINKEESEAILSGVSDFYSNKMGRIV